MENLVENEIVSITLSISFKVVLTYTVASNLKFINIVIIFFGLGVANKQTKISIRKGIQYLVILQHLPDDIAR